MSANERETEPAEPWFSGWRKIIFWLAGAVLLAVVGYRGALGSSMAGAAPLRPTGSPDERPPGAPVSPAAGIHTTAASPGTPTASASGTAARPVDPPPSAPEPSAATAKDPPPPDPSGSAAAAAPAITSDGKIILNLATEVELRQLPGIGRARAQAILEQRRRLGKFRRLEELLRVKGIGPRRLVALRPKVVLDPP